MLGILTELERVQNPLVEQDDRRAHTDPRTEHRQRLAFGHAQSCAINLHDVDRWVYRGFGGLRLLGFRIDSGQDRSILLSRRVAGDPSLLVGGTHFDRSTACSVLSRKKSRLDWRWRCVETPHTREYRSDGDGTKRRTDESRQIDK